MSAPRKEREDARGRDAKSMFDSDGGYEYGVLYEAAPDAPHRSGMTELDARIWIDEWIEMGAKPEAVSLIRRPLGRWERVPRSAPNDG